MKHADSGALPVPAVPRERIAYHEAGHAVILYIVGFEIKSVSIKPGETFHGITRWDNPLESWNAEMTKTPDVAEQVVIGLFAGQSSERRLSNVYPTHVPDHDNGWDNDNTEATRFLRTHCIGDNNELPEDLQAKLRYNAENLVEKHWEQIDKIAKLLLDRETIYTADITAIMEPQKVKEWEALAAKRFPATKESPAS